VLKNMATETLLAISAVRVMSFSVY